MSSKLFYREVTPIRMGWSQESFHTWGVFGITCRQMNISCSELIEIPVYLVASGFHCALWGRVCLHRRPASHSVLTGHILSAIVVCRAHALVTAVSSCGAGHALCVKRLR